MLVAGARARKATAQGAFDAAAGGPLVGRSVPLVVGLAPLIGASRCPTRKARMLASMQATVQASDDEFKLCGHVIADTYRVDSVAGVGGFGVVYRATHLKLDCRRALKCLKLPSDNPVVQRSMRDHFVLEAQRLAALAEKSSSFVKIHGIGTAKNHEGLWFDFLELEWLDGAPLSIALEERMGRGGLGSYSESEAIALLRPAIEALAVAHRLPRPIAHRDITPANLFLTEQDGEETLKVIDLGISKVMEKERTAEQLAGRETSNALSFSKFYGAPEQFFHGKNGLGATGPWTDVHALGLLLVELVTGKPALDQPDIASLCRAAASEKRPTPRARGARRVSDGFEAVCAKALALRSIDRYGDAGELLDALDALCPASTRRRKSAEETKSETGVATTRITSPETPPASFAPPPLVGRTSCAWHEPSSATFKVASSAPERALVKHRSGVLRAARVTRRATGSRPASDEVAALAEKLYAVVCANPGAPMPKLASLLGTSPRALNRPAIQLRRTGRLRSELHAHGPRYFPMTADIPAASARAGARYTVHVGSHRIEVDEQFEEHALRRLVQVLASC